MLRGEKSYFNMSLIIICALLLLVPASSIAAEFYEGFEGSVVGQMPTNWTQIYSGNAMYVSDLAPAEGVNSFFMQGRPYWASGMKIGLGFLNMQSSTYMLNFKMKVDDSSWIGDDGHVAAILILNKTCVYLGVVKINGVYRLLTVTSDNEGGGVTDLDIPNGIDVTKWVDYAIGINTIDSSVKFFANGLLVDSGFARSHNYDGIYDFYGDTLSLNAGSAGPSGYPSVFFDGFSIGNISSAYGGGKIAYECLIDGNWEICSMDDDGSQVVQLTNTTAIEQRPSISPDGKQIAFWSTISGQYEVYLMNADGANVTKLTTNATNDASYGRITWHPSGQSILYVAKNDGVHNVYLIGKDGSNPSALFADGYDRNWVSYNKNGSKIFYSKGQPYNFYSCEVYSSNADGTNETRLTNFATGYSDVGVSAWPGVMEVNGEGKIVFVRGVAYNKFQLFMMNEDGSSQQQITNSDSSDYNPIGNYSVPNVIYYYSRSSSGAVDLWKINYDGSGLTKMTTSGVNANPSWWVPDAPLDTDSDGLVDIIDNCPAVANPDQTDFDGDSMGDVCDADIDNDSILNTGDNCPLASNADQLNSDNDSLGDACDSDNDNDGISNAQDNCEFAANPNQADIDMDGLGDVCDADPDGDGILASDNCPFTPNPDQTNSDLDAYGDACDPDDDNDTIFDAVDNCPTVANTDQLDMDTDSIGDICDVDIDGDAIENDADDCPYVANVGQDDTDFDTVGDACDDDDDNDFVFDVADNCPLIANADQSDLDGDGRGDACDADLDGDGVANDIDNCLTIANANQSNWDLDILGDVCDGDIDGDGVVNASDECGFTIMGEVIDPANGCAIAQLVPCNAPRGTTVPWKNHGAFVSNTTQVLKKFLEDGLITQEQRDAMMNAAASSACGSK